MKRREFMLVASGLFVPTVAYSFGSSVGRFPEAYAVERETGRIVELVPIGERVDAGDLLEQLKKANPRAGMPPARVTHYTSTDRGFRTPSRIVLPGGLRAEYDERGRVTSSTLPIGARSPVVSFPMRYL